MGYTRITNGYMTEMVVQNLLTNRNKLVDLQSQISSGKRITKPSDDVLSSISVVSTNSSLGKIDNYLKNLSNAKNELDVTEKTLSMALDSINRAKELTVQAANASAGPQELSAINAEIEQIIEQVKNFGNTKFGTNYIFGGFKTDSPPFGVPAAGEIEYTGSAYGSHEREVEINDGVTIAVNLSGDQVFGYYYTGDHDNNVVTPDTLDGQGLIRTLSMLSTELQAATPDKDVIRTRLDDLETDLNTVLNALSQVGSISTRIDLTQDSLENDKVNLTKIKSDAEDIDMAKAISDLQFQQTALEASLSVSAQIIQPSLLNFLG